MDILKGGTSLSLSAFFTSPQPRAVLLSPCHVTLVWGKQMRLFMAGGDHPLGPDGHLWAPSRHLKAGTPLPLFICTPPVVTQLAGSATELWNTMPRRLHVAFLASFLPEPPQPGFLHSWATCVRPSCIS